MTLSFAESREQRWTLARVRRSYIDEHYPIWVRNNRHRPSDISRLRSEASNFGYRPLVSIILPVYEPERMWLERAMDSVLSQVYPNWELCVCDDGSTKEHVREVLSFYGRLDSRIKVTHLPTNVGISEASNTALSLATGEFVGLLDHDDELTPDALFEVVKLLQDHPDADLIYTDEDKIDEKGNRSYSHFKPEWSPDLLLSCNYISHLGVYRKSLIDEIGAFRKGFEGCQDYDLTLRFTEATQSIFHIPKVLYHWRAVAGSTASFDRNKDYIRDRAHRALAEALKRRGIEGSVEDGFIPNRFRVKRDIKGEPKVSIIIPTRDNVSLLRRCIDSIERLTTYHNYEILIVDNDSVDPETVEYMASSPHRVIPFEEEFNYSKINNVAAKQAGGEYLLFLNDDTEVISEEWLEAMLQHAQRPEVGAVGAQLLYPDGRIQHAGVITGAGASTTAGVAVHAHQYYPAMHEGYLGYITMTGNCSAVTAACMMLRRAVFEQAEGFDEDNLPITFNDVDLCLRLRQQGYLVVYTPYAKLYHHESVSRGFTSVDPKEAVYMRERWGKLLDNDPYYNPNFSLGSGDFNIRADMLRPRVLTEERLETQDEKRYMHPRVVGKEEWLKYLDQRRRELRNSRSTTLVVGSSEAVSKPKQARPERANGLEPQSNGRSSARETSGAGKTKLARRIATEQFVWMFGSPRTGSTWLSRIMDEHPDQVLWHEPYVGALFGSFYHSLKGHPLLGSRQFILGKPLEEVWLRSIKDFIMDGATARFPKLKGGQYLIVKEPNGSMGAPLIMKAMPESKMIFLIRDSRDVVASRIDAARKGGWGVANWDLDTAEKLNDFTRQVAQQYLDVVSATKEAYETHAGSKTFVKYEDLNRDPFNVIKSLYEDLEMPVDGTSLEAAVDKHSWDKIPESERGPGKFYRKAQPGGWREDLSTEQVEIIEGITGLILSEYNYELDTKYEADREPNGRTLSP